MFHTYDVCEYNPHFVQSAFTCNLGTTKNINSGIATFFKAPLPPLMLLLGSPMLVDHHPSQKHLGLHQAVWRPEQEVTRPKVRLKFFTEEVWGRWGSKQVPIHLGQSHFTCTPHVDPWLSLCAYFKDFKVFYNLKNLAIRLLSSGTRTSRTRRSTSFSQVWPSQTCFSSSSACLSR